MGLLTVGEPLNWTETKKNSDFIRRKGIQQFIKLYHTFLHRDNDPLKYGDEVEYSLIKFDHKQKRVYLLLKAEKILPELIQGKSNKLASWTPEFTNYMIEGIPGRPYEQDLDCILDIEDNMKLRRKQAQSVLESNESLMTFSTFPLIAAPKFTWPHTPNNQIETFFSTDFVFKSHPRFLTVAKNVRERHNSEPCIFIPIFIDKNTPQPFIDDLSAYESDDLKLPRIEDNITIDILGGSCACLQVTFQAKNLDQARFLYDQLAPFTPIILALSAASPIWRGFLCDIDCRWKVLSDMLDDRTSEEMHRIPKSRFNSLDCYLTEEGSLYNDIQIIKDEDYYTTLIESGVDHLIAQHVSHLFIRDPIVVYRQDLNNDDENNIDQWENIQSTNWQSLRFKPPPKCDIKSTIGWRVEFRTCELQITDFENAAFAAFLTLLVKIIVKYKLNFLLPISKIDENMKRAVKRDACVNEKFFFRANLNDTSDVFREMSINEIINGSESFQGVIPLMKDFLNEEVENMSEKASFKLKSYLDVIAGKANGSVKTTASWMRSFVQSHEKYNFDSIVSNEIAYDLIWHLNQISNEFVKHPNLSDF